MQIVKPRFPDPTLQLGRHDEYGDLSIPYAARDAHLHVIGQTRSGKSRFLADLIRQDIVNSRGLALIDPHGELYDLTVNWLAQSRMAANVRTIHPIELADPSISLRFNPLHINEPGEAYAVGGMVANALTRIYGGKDPNSTPLIKATLNAVCVILARRGLPLAAAEYFLLQGDKEIRDQIVQNFPDPYYTKLGQRFSRMSPKEFHDTVSSTERRLRDFIGNPMVRRIFSHTEDTMNLREMMDKRHVVLLNTVKKNNLIDFNELRAIAMLFANNTFQTAFTRGTKTKPTPFYMYLDEVQTMVSDDIENILSQAAKFGLFLTLSHQTLAHLSQAGEHVYHGVMSGTLIKAVFRIPMLEAHVFADELFADEVDFERIKQGVKSPATVGHKIEMLPSESNTIGQSKSETDTATDGTTDTRATAETKSRSTGEAETESESGGTTRGTVSTVGSGESVMFAADPDGLFSVAGQIGAGEFTSEGVSEILGEMSGWSYTKSRIDVESSSNSLAEAHSIQSSKSKALGRAESSSLTEGLSATLVPDIQWIATQTYTLEEQRYDLARRIARQKKRHAFLAIMGETTIGFTTRDIPDPLHLPKAERALIERLTEKSAWLSFSAEQSIEMDVSNPLDAIEQEQKPEPAPDSYFDED